MPLNRIKLQEPGSTLVMTIASVKPETIEAVDYWLFSDGVNELPVPVSSMASRLVNLQVESVNDLVGSTIKFGRSVKLNKFKRPFWDAEFTEPETGEPMEETGAPPKAQPAKAPPATPAVGTDTLPALATTQIVGKYLTLLDRVAEHIKAKTGADFLDYATSQPIAATCWITLKDKGLV